VVAFALLAGDSLLSGVGFDIRLSFGLWCSAVSTVPIALVVSPGYIGVLVLAYGARFLFGLRAAVWIVIVEMELVLDGRG
jgi:hypothetical protein